MRIGIVGFEGVGRTTLFSVLTGQEVATHVPGEHHLASVEVAEPRLEKLRDLWQPRKFTRARFEIEDLPALPRGDVSSRGERIVALREPDALLLVAGAFEEATLRLPRELADPIAQARAIADELLLLDLESVEKRLTKTQERMKKGAGDRAQQEREAEHLARFQAALEKDGNLKPFTDGESRRLLLELKLFRDKPWVTVFNVSEATLTDAAAVAKLKSAVDGAAVLCAPIEKEIAQLEGADRAAFLAEYGLAEPAAALLTRRALQSLDLISFFTMGPDEVRAWPIPRGTSAVGAAGKIHTDLARGFIRAEVIPFARIEKATDQRELKAASHAELMGRDYVVQDGDILNIRFSV